MYSTIRRRLILLYTSTTGLILTIVLLLVVITNKQELIKSKRNNFQNNFFNISNNIQRENVVSHLWLSELEVKNELIVHIEDNGKALMFQGANEFLTSRNKLISKVKKLAMKDGIHTYYRPTSMSEIRSNIYKITGAKGEQYFGAVYIVPTKLGYRSLILIEYIDRSSMIFTVHDLMYLLFDGIGIIGFYIISRLVVGSSLQQVEESRRRQNEFIAAASHELKSPLAVIQANASAIKIEPEQSDHFMKGIERECSRLKSLIEDMLILATADSNRWNVKREWIDMDTLIIDLYELYSPLYKNQLKELKLELQEELLPRMKGDKLRINQIIVVLIDNALSFSRVGDSVILNVYSSKNLINIQVIDHGDGILDEDKKMIFERFYRADKSRNSKAHFGLGLSIAKELVNLHNGKITVGDTIGGGATFKVSLPVEKERYTET